MDKRNYREVVLEESDTDEMIEVECHVFLCFVGGPLTNGFLLHQIFFPKLKSVGNCLNITKLNHSSTPGRASPKK